MSLFKFIKLKFKPAGKRTPLAGGCVGSNGKTGGVVNETTDGV